MKNKQIFISGPSGSGKTTLAKYIAREYNLPFVSCSTKGLWREWKISSHSEIMKKSQEDYLWGLYFQEAVLNYREKHLRGLENFVTDRSPLDNMLYFLLQNAPFVTVEQSSRYLERCKQQFQLYENAQQIYLEPHLDKLEDDNMRINNPHYQLMTHMVMKYIIEHNWLGSKRKVLVIEDWDWENRLDIINQFFDNQQPSLCARVRKKFGL